MDWGSRAVDIRPPPPPQTLIALDLYLIHSLTYHASTKHLTNMQINIARFYLLMS